MSLKEEFLGLKELLPYIFFLLKEIVLIVVTIGAIKLIIFIVELAFGEKGTLLMTYLDYASQVSIFLMFIIHSAVALWALTRKTFENEKHKR